MSRLQDQVVVVTGAGAGLGRGVARRLAREGATVVIADIDEAAGLATRAQIEGELQGAAIFRRTDVSDEQDARDMIAEVVERFGRIDALVNDAQSYSPLARLEDKTTQMYEHSLRSGLYGSLWTMQAAFPHMRSQGGGRIVNFCSLNGMSGMALLSDYNTTKEAIRGLTRSAAREWGHLGIRVNCVAPLGMSPAHAAFEAENPEFAQRLRSTIALGYVGDAEADIGAAVLFLISEDGRYVTGTTLFVDGGLHLAPLGAIDIRTWEPSGEGNIWPAD